VKGTGADATALPVLRIEEGAVDRWKPVVRSLGLAALLLLVRLGGARAGEVAAVSAAAVRAPLEAAAALSESTIGERLLLTFGTAGVVADRVAAGSPVDLVVLPPARLDDLARRGLVEAGSVPLGTVRLGLAVRSGASPPGIATEADVRAALLAAPSIGLADPASGATTGVFFARRLAELGLSEALKPRIRLFPDGTAAMEALARGEVALAAGQISEIRPVAGVDLVGPLPEALQLRTVYAVGVAAHTTRPEAARAMIALLRSARMAPAFSAAGFEPPMDAPSPP
jgi:molybdate transport system substrate-binding protein